MRPFSIVKILLLWYNFLRKARCSLLFYYIVTILISMALIVTGNAVFTMPIGLDEILWLALETTIYTVGVIAVDGLFAFLIRRLTPMKWYKPGRRIFSVSKKEKNFYNKIKIKSWKDKVPELGGFTSFHKNEFKTSSDSAYLERFIIESNYGVIIHLENALFGFLIMLIPCYLLPYSHGFSVWFPVCAVNFVLSMLPVFILRYTNYTLLRLYNKSQRKKSGTNEN